MKKYEHKTVSISLSRLELKTLSDLLWDFLFNMDEAGEERWINRIRKMASMFDKYLAKEEREKDDE